MKTPRLPKVTAYNMTGNSGREVPNQLIIEIPKFTLFQSYGSIIVCRGDGGKVYLDKRYWDYSVTTGRYRSRFLGEDKRETQRKIDSGQYELVNLN